MSDNPTTPLFIPIQLDKESCSDFKNAETTEWLVTNGIGGYAFGTVANLLTRRYHGLLVAALHPPLGRTLLATKLDETVEINGQVHRIFTNRWGNILVEPHGYRHLVTFQLDGTIPVWTYAFGDALLEKRVWMKTGENTTYVCYCLKQSSSPMNLQIRALVNYRDFHSETQGGDWQMQVKKVDRGMKISAFEGAVPFRILSDRANIVPEHHWYRNFSLSMEQSTKSPVMEDHLNIGEFRINLNPGENVTFVISTSESPNLDGLSVLAEKKAYEDALIANAPDIPARLVLAADQFIVKRDLPDVEEGRSIIAGYPWLRDWARDTLISLPGLTLTTGRYSDARAILLGYSKYVSEGMLPNCFPNPGENPEYKTADVTLWYFEAIRAYIEETGDVALLKELFPILQDIIDWHLKGTRFKIKMDPEDGLLYAGQPGFQLTWMDSRWGDWVVTPRMGKAVEINALWYNALCSMKEFAEKLDTPYRSYSALANKVKDNFSRFWNNDRGYCFDVIDTPGGNDASLRPNQLIAVSLHFSAFSKTRQKRIVDICNDKLLIPMGLRSLATDEPGYIGRYDGDPRQAIGSYHQGTAWAWLIGPFISAHFRVYNDRNTALSFLQPFLNHMHFQCVGTISELFEGNSPYESHGCIAQAWSVAEILRVYRQLIPRS